MVVRLRNRYIVWSDRQARQIGVPAAAVPISPRGECMLNKVRWLSGAVVLLSAAALSATPPASAAPAAVGLALTVDAAPSFTPGTIGEVSLFCDDNPQNAFSSAAATLFYRATSPSGISGYDIRALYAGGIGSSQHYSSASPLSWTASNYNGDCGGGSQSQVGWRITAHDRAGTA